MPFGEAPEDANHYVVLWKRITHAMPAEDAEDCPDEMKQDSDMVNLTSQGRKVTIAIAPVMNYRRTWRAK